MAAFDRGKKNIVWVTPCGAIVKSGVQAPDLTIARDQQVLPIISGISKIYKSPPQTRPPGGPPRALIDSG